MSSKSKSTTTNTSTPNAATTALFNPTFDQAKSLINTPFTPYSGQLAPGLTAPQTQAIGLAQSNVGTGQGAVQQGISAAQGVAGYHPSQVSATGAQAVMPGQAAQAQASMPGSAAQAQGSFINPSSIPQVGSGMLDTSRIAALLDPATQNVIDTTNRDIDTQRQRSINGQDGQFTQAGAWGGSRQGVADSLTNEAYGKLTASTDASLNSQNYNQARAAAQAEAGRAQSGQQSNASNTLSALGTNAGLGTNVNVSNAGAQNQLAGLGAQLGTNVSEANTGAQNQFGLAGAQLGTNVNLANSNQQYAAQTANQAAGLQGQGLNLSASGMLGNLGGQANSLNQSQIGQLGQLGGVAQQTQGAQDAANYSEFLRGQQYPLQQAGMLQGLLGSIPALYAGATTTGNTQSSTLNPLGWLQALAKASAAASGD